MNTIIGAVCKIRSIAPASLLLWSSLWDLNNLLKAPLVVETARTVTSVLEVHSSPKGRPLIYRVSQAIPAVAIRCEYRTLSELWNKPTSATIRLSFITRGPVPTAATFSPSFP